MGEGVVVIITEEVEAIRVRVVVIITEEVKLILATRSLVVPA